MLDLIHTTLYSLKCNSELGLKSKILFPLLYICIMLEHSFLKKPHKSLHLVLLSTLFLKLNIWENCWFFTRCELVFAYGNYLSSLLWCTAFSWKSSLQRCLVRCLNIRLLLSHLFCPCPWLFLWWLRKY